MNQEEDPAPRRDTERVIRKVSLATGLASDILCMKSWYTIIKYTLSDVSINFTF